MKEWVTSATALLALQGLSKSGSFISFILCPNNKLKATYLFVEKHDYTVDTLWCFSLNSVRIKSILAHNDCIKIYLSLHILILFRQFNTEILNLNESGSIKHLKSEIVSRMQIFSSSVKLHKNYIKYISTNFHFLSRAGQPTTTCHCWVDLARCMGTFWDINHCSNLAPWSRFASGLCLLLAPFVVQHIISFQVSATELTTAWYCYTTRVNDGVIVNGWWAVLLLVFVDTKSEMFKILHMGLLTNEST